MKQDKKSETTKKSVRKINIDDLPNESVRKSSGDIRKDSMGETKVFRDLPVNDDEDFEFEPDFDEMNFFDEEMIPGNEVEEEGTEERAARRERRRRPDADSIQEEMEEEILEEEVPGKRRVKKLRLTPEEIQERKAVRKKRRSQNPEILAVTYVFAFLFVLMIGYFVYFNAFVSKNVINSAYNVRVNSFADTIVRGDIISGDGTVLAETLVDENGNETATYDGTDFLPCGGNFRNKPVGD